VRRALVFALVWCGCREKAPSAAAERGSLSTEHAVVRQGESISVTARWPGRRGTVSFVASRGRVRPEVASLDEAGVARVRFGCFDSDAGACLGDLRIDASLGGEVASASLVAVADRDRDSRPTGGVPVLAPEFEVRARPTPGRDAGGGGTFSMGGSKTWWRWDGGVYEVIPDEPLGFDCEWDGGAHPGYTLPNGMPQATGCDGEPIDVVLWEFPGEDAVDFCGTVTFARPLRDPVYPRAEYAIRANAPVVVSSSTACCSHYFCLRNPSELRYRVRLDKRITADFSVGARTRNFGSSLFGPAPFKLDAQAVPAGSLVTLPTFTVGPGYRSGDPPRGSTSP
jgi:hypothetical protein